MKFGIFLEILNLALLGVKGLKTLVGDQAQGLNLRPPTLLTGALLPSVFHLNYPGIFVKKEVAQGVSIHK